MSESNVMQTAGAGASHLGWRTLGQRSGADPPVRQLALRHLSLDISGSGISPGQGNNSIVNTCTCGTWDVKIIHSREWNWVAFAEHD